jgi:hypothetical protein
VEYGRLVLGMYFWSGGCDSCFGLHYSLGFDHLGRGYGVRFKLCYEEYDATVSIRLPLNFC